MNRKKIGFYVAIPGLAISITAFLLYQPLFGEYQHTLGHSDKINVILTVSLACFAAYEGFSTLMQFYFERERKLIEDMRNKLEKAYGEVYATLYKQSPNIDITEELGIKSRIEKRKNAIILSPNQKNKIDNVFLKFSFYFDEKVFQLWKKKIQFLEHETTTYGAIKYYLIPLEFTERIKQEYDKKVKEYNKLINPKTYSEIK